MSKNCEIIVNFLINGQFGAIQRHDSEFIVYKPYIFIKSTFYLIHTENRTEKFYHSSHNIANIAL